MAWIGASGQSPCEMRNAEASFGALRIVSRMPPQTLGVWRIQNAPGEGADETSNARR
jgi:hypothetical protein